MNTQASPDSRSGRFGEELIETIARVAALTVLVVLCFQIARPFLNAILWGVIIAVAANPTYEALARRLRARRRLAAVLTTVVMLATFLVPSFFLAESLVTGAAQLATGMRDGTLKVPPPPAQVESWPIIGNRLASVWRLASQNLEAVLQVEPTTVEHLARGLLAVVADAGATLLQFVIATIIAGVLLARGERGSPLAHAVAGRFAGERGPGLVDLATRVVRSVARGILGVALLQSVLGGAGMLVAGIPAAGLLTLVCLVSCVVQLGPGIVLIPATIYLFSTADTFTAVAFLVWTILVLPLDNILKPILLGRGVTVPTLVMFIGAIGGFLRAGIIGLFLGAVVFAMGYELFRSWIWTRAENGDASR